MKKLITLILLSLLGSLTACVSSNEEAGVQEISAMYGGRIFLKKGTGVSTADGPQGSYLEVDLAVRGISKYYNDLQVPASNCAYLVYKHLTPRERTDYNYFKVNIQDSTAAHTYTFLPADLELAAQAGSNLTGLMFSLQGQDYTAVTSHLDPASLGALHPDSVTGKLHKIAALLAPSKEYEKYQVHGFEIQKTQLAGQAVPIVRFLISVPHRPQRPGLLFVYINPKPRTQQFLCGLQLL